jgi:RNA polymerase sigma-70 factor, ECF subfamily
MPEKPQAATLAPLVYANLRRLAQAYLGRGPRPSIQATELVHEAYAQLVSAKVALQGKTHFLALAATQMRRILVDRARRAAAAKHGGNDRRVTLDDEALADQPQALEVLALDRALEGLAARSQRQGRVAELKLFAGMSVAEVAQSLNVSERTVKLDWQLARAWLARELRAPAEMQHG